MAARSRSSTSASAASATVNVGCEGTSQAPPPPPVPASAASSTTPPPPHCLTATLGPPPPPHSSQPARTPRPRSYRRTRLAPSAQNRSDPPAAHATATHTPTTAHTRSSSPIGVCHSTRSTHHWLVISAPSPRCAWRATSQPRRSQRAPDQPPTRRTPPSNAAVEQRARHSCTRLRTRRARRPVDRSPSASVHGGDETRVVTDLRATGSRPSPRGVSTRGSAASHCSCRLHRPEHERRPTTPDVPDPLGPPVDVPTPTTACPGPSRVCGAATKPCRRQQSVATGQCRGSHSRSYPYPTYAVDTFDASHAANPACRIAELRAFHSLAKAVNVDAPPIQASDVPARRATVCIKDDARAIPTAA